MYNSGEILGSETAAERAQRSIEKTFNEIDLVDYLPKDSSEKTVAILGAGSAVELGAITNYFVKNGLNKPKIVCFDIDPMHKRYTEKLFSSQDINFEYRTTDIADYLSFKDEQYDMVIARKPDIHNGDDNWSKAFKNGFEHLKDGGVFLATTDIYADFIREELRKSGEIVRAYVIPEGDRVPPQFGEIDLFIARKIAK